MDQNPGTGDAAQPQAAGKKRSRGWRIIRTVLIGIIVSAALLIVFPPFGLIKDQVAKLLGDATGRTVTIGDLHFKIPLKLERPKLEAVLGDVRIANPPGMAERPVFQADTVRTTLDFLPLLKGRIKMESLTLSKPLFALEESVDGTRNWVFGATPVATTDPPAATDVPTATDAPPAANPTEAAPPATTQPAQTASFGLPPVTTIEAGALTFRSAKTGADRSLSDINADLVHDAIAGSATTKGNLLANNERVVFDAAVGDLDAVTTGGSSTLKGTVDSRLLRAELEGDALFAGEAEFKGDLAATSPSLIELVRWLGADTAATGEPLKTSLEGKVHATTRDVAFAETDVMINTTSSRFDGTLDYGADRPKLSGNIASEHLDLARIVGTTRRAGVALEAVPEVAFEPTISTGWDGLLDDLNALERGASAAPIPAQPEAAAAAAAAPSWSDQPFNLNALRSFDVDLLMTANAITYGLLDLKNAKVKTEINDGVLAANIQELAVGNGNATGTVNIDSRASPPKAAARLNLKNVAAEPIVTELTGSPLLSGTSNVEITASAAGQTQSQLTQTLDGKARFVMGKGALRGFDVRRMIFEWWKSWKFDLGMRTSFERLDAQYDIRRGIMRSQPGLSMGGPEVEINSTGSVNVPARSLDQNIRVKAIPPPTAMPIPVRISGNWTKPSVNVDWWGLFSAGPSVGGPQALAAAPESPPAPVEAAIRRVLAADLPSERLTPEAREMLRSLLPPEPDSGP